MKPVSRTEAMCILSNITQMVLGKTVIMEAHFRIKQAKLRTQRACNHGLVFTSPLTSFPKTSEKSFSLSGMDAWHKRKWSPSWVSPFPLPNDDGIRPDANYETFLQGSFLLTTMNLDKIDVEQVSSFLIRWDDTREQGIELSSDAFCQDTPDLLEAVQRGISDLKATDWMNELDYEEDNDFLSLPTSQALSRSKVKAVALSSALTLDELIFHVTSSGVLSETETSPVQQHLSSAEKPASAVDLAELLLEQNKLNRFLAELLYEGKSDGLLFGDYEILDKIADGGMGQVFKARHRRMDRVVALKLLSDRLVDSPLAAQRFEREVKAVAKLEHPNVVTAYDAGEVNGTHYLVMQYIEGQDLASLVKRCGRLSVVQSVDYIRQAAKGFEYAHSEGVIHRDIKPSNLLIDTKGTVKILDMGLARIDTEHDPHSPTQTELTQDGAVMGTVSYMPPEQALDTKSADARSDIYSLGCTLHFLLTGKPPYVGSTLMGTMLAHREDDCPMLSEIRSDVPKSLDAIFAKMIAKQPEERYQSMTQLLEDLAAVAETFSNDEETIEDSRNNFMDVDSAVETLSASTSSTGVDETRLMKTQAAPVVNPQWQSSNGRRFIGSAVAVLCFSLFSYWLYGVLIQVENHESVIQMEPNLRAYEVYVDSEKVITGTELNE
ncbi:MAG: serine/threonine protein kinase, partial [Planctomycetaceae bacterium]|nr:serine/threonine protein kinase [Planctomycetaceae bacterium]